MREVAALIHNGEQKVVVLSAVSGTTNKLVELAGCLLRGNREEAQHRLQALQTEYVAFIDELLPDPSAHQKGLAALDSILVTLRDCFNQEFTSREEKVVLAQGELLSTQLFHLYLRSQGLSSELLPALDFMRIDSYHEPELELIQSLLHETMEHTAPADY